MDQASRAETRLVLPVELAGRLRQSLERTHLSFLDSNGPPVKHPMRAAGAVVLGRLEMALRQQFHQTLGNQHLGLQALEAVERRTLAALAALVVPVDPDGFWFAMSANFRDRVRGALEKHHAKQIKTRRTKPNGKPEKAVEKSCLDWLRGNGFSVNVVESKAVFNAQAGRYIRGQADQGFADCVGCFNNGLAVFIEFKAPGRLATLRPAQKAFLREKIDCGAFAVVADSVDRLKEAWATFTDIRRTEGVAQSKDYLRSLIK